MNGNLSPRKFIWEKKPQKQKNVEIDKKMRMEPRNMLLNFMNETYSSDTNIQHWQIVAEQKGAVKQ